MGSNEPEHPDEGGRSASAHRRPFPPLGAELTIYTASETHAGWLAWFASTADRHDDAAVAVGVDARAVEAIDGAGMQLLLSLQRSLQARGLALDLCEPSAELLAACAVMGTGDRLRSAGPQES